MGRKLRVLHVLASLGLGGAECRLIDYLRAADRERFDHTLLCVSRGGELEEDVRRLDVPLFIARRRFRADPGVLLQLAGRMRDARADIVHTHNFTANLWGRTAAALARVPVIIGNEHGTAWVMTGTQIALNRPGDRVSARVVANSDASAAMVAGRLGTPRAKIRVLRPGVNPAPYRAAPGRAEARRALGLPAGAPLLAAVGRLVPTKGFDRLVDALPLIRREARESELLLIGDGPLRASLEKRLPPERRAGLRLLGARRDVPALLAAADLFVQPSIHESLGTTLVEAAFAGLPAVASRVDGIPEIVGDGSTGLLVEPTEPALPDPETGLAPPERAVDPGTGRIVAARAPSPEAIAGAALRLLGDPEERARLGGRARERALERFTPERYAAGIEALYLETAKEKGLV